MGSIVPMITYCQHAKVGLIGKQYKGLLRPDTGKGILKVAHGTEEGKWL